MTLNDENLGDEGAWGPRDEAPVTNDLLDQMAQTMGTARMQQVLALASLTALMIDLDKTDRFKELAILGVGLGIKPQEVSRVLHAAKMDLERKEI